LCGEYVFIFQWVAVVVGKGAAEIFLSDGWKIDKGGLVGKIYI